MEAPVDFLIITPLREERDAVLRKLEYRQLPPTSQDVRVYFAADLPITSQSKDLPHASYKLIVAPLLGMGRVEAANAAGDAIRRWQPCNVLLVGIAGGYQRAGVRLGDLLISEQVADYELQKITETHEEIRWSVHRVDPQLLGAAQNVLDDTWMNLLQVKRPRPGKPQLYFGPICTGDKVIASSLTHQYSDVWSRLIGVEMEAGGVASAAFQASSRPGFFMIRGVSDLADSQKDTPAVRSWRAYACDVAASFTIGLLRQGPILPQAARDYSDTSSKVGPGRTAGDTPTSAVDVKRRRGHCPPFWSSILEDSSRLHQRSAAGDPTVLIILVHGLNGHPVRTWGTLPKWLLDAVGDDADILSYAHGASPSHQTSVEEVAVRLAQLIIDRPHPYMHLFFLAENVGAIVVRELLAKDVESVTQPDSHVLDQLPPIASKARALFDLSNPPAYTDSTPLPPREENARAKLTARLRRALELLTINDFPRPRFVELGTALGSTSTSASEGVSGHDELAAAVLDLLTINDPSQPRFAEFLPGPGSTFAPASDRAPGPAGVLPDAAAPRVAPPLPRSSARKSRSSRSQVGPIATFMRPYFHSPEMIVSYSVLRRAVGLDGGISPTSSSPNDLSTKDRLGRSDWAGWYGSQEFALKRLAELSEPRAVRDHPRLVITGSAGIGKSTVLRRHARSVTARFLELHPATQLCIFVPMQNLTLDAAQLESMPPSGTPEAAWHVISHFWTSFLKAVILDPQEEIAFGKVPPPRTLEAWQTVSALLTPEWVETRAIEGPTKLILDGVDEFLVTYSSLTVDTISRLLSLIEQSSQKARTQCLLAVRDALPGAVELSRQRNDACEICPLSESAAETMFPGTRELLCEIHDQNLRRLLLSPLVLVHLGPRAASMQQGLLSTRAAILRQALEAVIVQSQLPLLDEHSTAGLHLDGWLQALALVAWILYRDSLGFITVSELRISVRALKALWSKAVYPVSHCFLEGIYILENDSTLNALRARTVLNSFGKDSLRFAHREWQDSLVADYLAQSALGQVFSELDHRAFAKQIYIDAANILWEQMTKAGVQIDSTWLDSAFGDNPFERPFALMSVCALLGNGPVDIDQAAQRRLMHFICDPCCPEVTRLVAVSSFCMRVRREDDRDQSLTYIVAQLEEVLSEIVRQGTEPDRKVSASMAWCYTVELGRRYPFFRMVASEWPALSAVTDSGVAAAGASGMVWRQEDDSVVVDARCRSFQIAVAQYPLAVRALPNEEISLTHYLFLAAATLRAGAATSEIFPLLRAVFAPENGVVDRVQRCPLPEVRTLFDSCREAAQGLLATEAVSAGKH